MHLEARVSEEKEVVLEQLVREEPQGQKVTREGRVQRESLDRMVALEREVLLELQGHLENLERLGRGVDQDQLDIQVRPEEMVSRVMMVNLEYQEVQDRKVTRGLLESKEHQEYPDNKESGVQMESLVVMGSLGSRDYRVMMDARGELEARAREARWEV